MAKSFDEILRLVRWYYEQEGLTVAKRSVGYALDGYEFSETIDDADIRLFLTTAERLDPANIFVIGNAFGWSTLCLSAVFPKAHIDVIDAEMEGPDVGFGSALTRGMAAKYGLHVRLRKLKSPDQVPVMVERKKYDLALIDGRHGDMQLVEDFTALMPFMQPKNIVFMPTVKKNQMWRGIGLVEMVANLMDYDFFERAADVTPAGTAIAARRMSINPKRAADTKVMMI